MEGCLPFPFMLHSFLLGLLELPPLRSPAPFPRKTVDAGTAFAWTTTSSTFSPLFPPLLPLPLSGILKDPRFHSNDRCFEPSVMTVLRPSPPLRNPRLLSSCPRAHADNLLFIIIRWSVQVRFFFSILTDFPRPFFLCF